MALFSADLVLWQTTCHSDSTFPAPLPLPAIPGSYYTFLTLIRRFQEEAPNASRKVLKRRIMNQLSLPLEMDDPYGDEWEFSYLRSSRTRLELFENRFNLAMDKITVKRRQVVTIKNPDLNDRGKKFGSYEGPLMFV